MRRRYPTFEPVRDIAVDVERVPKQVWSRASTQRLRRPKRPPRAVANPLLHSIRQRAFELGIDLRGLDADLRARGDIIRGVVTKRLPRIVFEAAAMLGGKVVLVEDKLASQSAAQPTNLRPISQA